MKNLFGLTIFLICSNFIFGQQCEETDSITLFETSRLEKEIKKGQILKKVVDTITTDKIYMDYAWTFNEKIDYKSKSIEFQLLLNQEVFWYDDCIKERNVYFIKLSKYDSIFVEGKYTKKVDTLLNSMCSFIKNEFLIESLPEKCWKIIPYFDSVQLTKHQFEINSVMVPDSLGNKSNWNLLNPILNVILNSYIEVRNQLSIQEWNKSFRNLHFEQQVAVIKHYPLNIWLYPIRQDIKPPPPPPYEMTEEYILDSINKYYQRRAIEEINE